MPVLDDEYDIEGDFDLDYLYEEVDYLWEPTGDTLYGDSIGAEATFGKHYDKMMVEKQNDGWHASLFVVAEPRDEIGGIEYDLWPDDGGDLFTMVDEDVFPTIESAQGWCEGRDGSADN